MPPINAIRNTVLGYLDQIRDDDVLIDRFNGLIAEEGMDAYSAIFNVLTNLDIQSKEAEKCWEEIVSHYRSLSRALGRKVNLRTAICDYFCSIHESLVNPKVVEIHIFEKTVKASRYDSLTGLLNRLSFDETFEQELKRANRHGSELSILFFDIDDFKKINDTHGHQAGDLALRHFADIILKEKRSEDVAARYGGEEMVVILPETGRMNALVLGERIREKLEKTPFAYRGQTLSFTVSGGLAAYPVNAEDSVSLLKCADIALYRAKGSGKNNISFFSEDKRRFLRIDFDSPVQVQEVGFNGKPSIEAKGKNICVGGVLFSSDRPLPIGAKVQLSVPTEKDKPLFIIGTVVRIEQFSPELYDIGISISFLEMDKAIKREISRWLRLKRRENEAAGNGETP